MSQQGHSPAFYRDHPQDIRHRTVQSRRPPPVTSHLIKGDPDSATSPSKYDDRNDSRYEAHRDKDKDKNSSSNSVVKRGGTSAKLVSTGNADAAMTTEQHRAPLPDVALVNQRRRSIASPVEELEFLNVDPATLGQSVDETKLVEPPDLDKELEAAIEETSRLSRPLDKSLLAAGKDFRTLSTSSSEEADVAPKTVKSKFKKTPLPKRKSRRRKKKPDDLVEDQEVDRKPQRSEPGLARKGPKADTTARGGNKGEIEDLEDLERLSAGDVKLAGAAGKVSNAHQSSSVSHKEIQKFLHKSKMLMDVDDVRRAMQNAKAIGAKEHKKQLKDQSLPSDKTDLTTKLRNRSLPRMIRSPTKPTTKESTKNNFMASPPKSLDKTGTTDNDVSLTLREVTKPGGRKEVPAAAAAKDKVDTKNNTVAPRTLKPLKQRVRQPRSNDEEASQTNLKEPKNRQKEPSQVLKMPPAPQDKQEQQQPKAKTGPEINPPMTSGPPKLNSSSEESAKRLELIKAARASKQRGTLAAHSPPSVQGKAGGGGGTFNKAHEKVSRVSLPIMIKSEKPQPPTKRRRAPQQQSIYADADEDFYREFRIIFVTLPVPKDDLPREFSGRLTCLNLIQITFFRTYN